MCSGFCATGSKNPNRTEIESICRAKSRTWFNHQLIGLALSRSQPRQIEFLGNANSAWQISLIAWNIRGCESRALIVAAIRRRCLRGGLVVWRVCIHPQNQPRAETKRVFGEIQGLTWKQLNPIRIVMGETFIRFCLFLLGICNKSNHTRAPKSRPQCLSITSNANMRLSWPVLGLLSSTYARTKSSERILFPTDIPSAAGSRRKGSKHQLVRGFQEKIFSFFLKSLNNFFPRKNKIVHAGPEERKISASLRLF